MITKESTAEEIFRELTMLPPEHQERHGGENFMRAGRFRHNGIALTTAVADHVRKNGGEWEVVLGFVDPSLAESTGISEHGEFDAEMTVFSRAVIRRGGRTSVISAGA